MTQDPSAEAIDLIYRSPLEPGLWKPALELVGGVIGRKAICVARQGFPAGVEAMHSVGLDEGAVAEFYERFSDPGANGAAQAADAMLQRDRLVFWHDFVPENDFESWSLKQDLYNRLGVAADLVSVLGAGPDGVSLVATIREADAPRLPEARIRRGEALLPHIRRAFALSLELESRRLRERTFEAAFDLLAAAVFVTDGARRVLHMNARAREIVASRDGLVIVGGRLRGVEAGFRDWLGGEIAAAAARAGGPAAEARLARRSSGRRPYLVTVAPSPIGGRGGPSCAIVIASDPDRDFEARVAQLRAATGLSEMQARIALAIVDGRDYGAIARAHGVSPNTVKTHARRLYGRLDCRDRQELTRLVLLYLAPLA